MEKSEIKNLKGEEYLYPYSFEIIKKYGQPETLKGTDNNKWIAYFPKGDFTILVNKKTDIIKNVYFGKL